MVINEMKGDLTQAEVQRVIEAINQIRADLPFLLGLTPKERKAMRSVGDGRLSYVQKCTAYASNSQERIGIADDDLAELKHYAQLFEDLTTLHRLANDLDVSLRDTKMQAGAILYRLSRMAHKQMRLAHRKGRPGMDTILEDLDTLFKNQGKAKAPRAKKVALPKAPA